MESKLKKYRKYFLEHEKGALSLNLRSHLNLFDYRESISLWCQETISVRKHIKIAFPEWVNSPVFKDRQNLLPAADATKYVYLLKFYKIYSLK